MIMDRTKVHQEVQKRYGGIARVSGGSCCGGGGCGDTVPQADRIGSAVGYSGEDLAALPEGANLGLGCGNPVALAEMRPGETVLDLGSGAGIDCFLAAKKVGPEGRVIGVDMTPEMLERARANAVTGGYDNVDFRQGHIEALPVEDKEVDVVISNCVINLSPDKPQVFREAFRALKPGGRLYVSDLVLLQPLPKLLQRSVGLYTACVAGALQKQDYLAAIEAAGFGEIRILGEAGYGIDLLEADPTLRPWVRLGKWIPYFRRTVESVVSIKIAATKA